MNNHIEIHQSKIYFKGNWTLPCIDEIREELVNLSGMSGNQFAIDGTSITKLDTAGAWLLKKTISELEKKSTLNITGFSDEHLATLDMIAHASDNLKINKRSNTDLFYKIGLNLWQGLQQIKDILAFLGEMTHSLINSLARPSRLRWRAIFHNLQIGGFNALPITGLLAFLMGVVIAYQGAEQLRRYGANIFVVDLIGLTMLREIAPMLTAIIVAGRSGSAYAAQIGTMKVAEEIDTMRTIGIAPMEWLVLPKLLALMLALPLLTVYADILGVMGGMVMAKFQLGVSFDDFIERFSSSIKLSAYLTGIGKAPVFAAIIVVIGCFQGFQAKGGADSVGRQTTISVVQGIFWVIIADAIFSIAFSWLKI